jgi:hypothetical protein
MRNLIRVVPAHSDADDARLRGGRKLVPSMLMTAIGGLDVVVVVGSVVVVLEEVRT